MESVTTKDRKADKVVKTMVYAVIGGAIIPAHVNWALTATALGAGVISIGRCYNVEITRDEAWKLIKQFFLAAGSWFIAMNIGTKIFAMVLSSTGIGHLGAVALDSTISGAAAYAIGACAKDYFRRDYLGKAKISKDELGEKFREAFQKKKSEIKVKKSA